MNYYVSVLFDNAAGAYSRPMFDVSRGSAVRAFMDEVKKESSPIYAHPEDYSLYEVGIYSDHDAGFTLVQAPLLICRAVDFKE